MEFPFAEISFCMANYTGGDKVTRTASLASCFTYPEIAGVLFTCLAWLGPRHHVSFIMLVKASSSPFESCQAILVVHISHVWFRGNFTHHGLNNIRVLPASA
jgi:hypothetical protein